MSPLLTEPQQMKAHPRFFFFDLHVERGKEGVEEERKREREEGRERREKEKEEEEEGRKRRNVLNGYFGWNEEIMIFT